MPATRFRFTYVVRPGRTLPPDRRARLVDELREVAAACFPVVPDYQVVGGDPDALDRAVLMLARDDVGRLVGFCSTLLLQVPGIGEVLHLGLTCVHPDARGQGLTQPLLSGVVARYLLLHRPFTGAWFTSAASVISSLANTALYFEEVFPSPFREAPPTPAHRAIAEAVAAEHRGRLHLREDARFDPHRFVFEGGNRDTMFCKSADDAQYHHRDPELTRWFAGLADLDAGDAVLQVGRFSVPGFVRYAAAKAGRQVPGLRDLLPAPRVVPLLGSVERA